MFVTSRHMSRTNLSSSSSRGEDIFDSVDDLHKPIQSSTNTLLYTHLSTMSLSLLRTSLRSGQPSIARGFASSTIKFQQPLKTAHPADVVSGNVAGIPATQPEDTRALAAEVVSDAPSKCFDSSIVLMTNTTQNEKADK